MDDMQKSALNRLLTVGSDLNECAVYDCQPYACFKLAEVVEHMLRKSISPVNHGLTQRAPVTPLLVLCLAFFNKKSVTKRKQALQEVVQGHVASDHG